MASTLIKGDHIRFPIQLTKGGSKFEISSSATVKAAFTSSGSVVSNGQVTIAEATAGSDWSNSLIVFDMLPAQSTNLAVGTVDLEVQVEDGAVKPETWQLTESFEIVVGAIV